MAELTSVRFRITQRRSFTRTGSGHADTGSPASQSSRSCASIRGESKRSSARCAMAFKQIASRGSGISGVDLARAPELTAACVTQRRRDLPIHDRVLAGQQVVQRRSQAIDIAGEPNVARVSLCLLRAHERRSPHGEPGDRVGRPAVRRRPDCRLVLQNPILVLADALGQAPVDDQGFAVLAHDHVRRLEVSVNHPAAVCVVDRIADVDEAPEQLLEPQRRLARTKATAATRLCETAGPRL